MSAVMKARKLSYWIGLLCVAVLVLMPDVTVNAQPDPGEQDSNGQMLNEVDLSTDTQTPTEQQTSEDKASKEQPEREEVEKSLLEAGCRLVKSGTYDCPAGTRFAGIRREAEQSLIENGCRHSNTSTDPFYGGVYNEYHCPRGSRFAGGEWFKGEPIGLPGWMCLVSPDRADRDFLLGQNPREGWAIWAVGEVRRGECVPPIGGGGAIREPIRNGQSPREVGVEQIPEPASDSQGESDQQRAESAQQQAKGVVAQADEEAPGEENKPSNHSQENANSKKGYGCSANQ